MLEKYYLEDVVKVGKEKTSTIFKMNSTTYAGLNRGGHYILVRTRSTEGELETYIEEERCIHASYMSPTSMVFIPEQGNPDRGKLLCNQCAIEHGITPYNGVSVKVRDVRKLPVSVGFEFEIILAKPLRLRVHNYHSGHGSRFPLMHDMRLEHDASITGIGGVEIVSTIFNNSEWLLGELAAYFHLMKEYIIAHPRAGTHIHVGGMSLELSHLSRAEEVLAALGGDLLRFLNSEYARPIKQGAYGHYANINFTGHTTEFRSFTTTTSFFEALFRIALTVAVSQVAEELPEVDRNMTLSDAARSQFVHLSNLAGWYDGGEWIGWPVKPGRHPRRMKFKAWWGNRVVMGEEQIPSMAYIRRYVNNKLAAFKTNIKVADLIDMAAGRED